MGGTTYDSIWQYDLSEIYCRKAIPRLLTSSAEIYGFSDDDNVPFSAGPDGNIYLSNYEGGQVKIGKIWHSESRVAGQTHFEEAFSVNREVNQAPFLFSPDYVLLDPATKAVYPYDSAPKYVPSLPDSAVLCENPLTITPRLPPGATGRWADLPHGNERLVDTPGVYYYMVTHPAGCTVADSVMIVPNLPPRRNGPLARPRQHRA